MTSSLRKLSFISKKEFKSKFRSEVTLLSSNSDYELVPVLPSNPTVLIKIFQKPAFVISNDDVVARPQSERARVCHEFWLMMSECAPGDVPAMKSDFR